MQKHNCSNYVHDSTMLVWLELWDGLTRDAWRKGGLSLRRNHNILFFCFVYTRGNATRRSVVMNCTNTMLCRYALLCSRASSLTRSKKKSEHAPHQHRRRRYIVMRCQHASLTYICSDESQREHTNNATPLRSASICSRSSERARALATNQY